METNLEKIRRLDGRSVLVKPARSSDPNSVGLRGTLHVHDLPGNEGVLRVEITLDYPELGDVAGRTAHRETIPLSQTDVLGLLEHEVGGAGAYEYTLDDGGRTVP